MITKPICFLLGAGASSCYNFPLGKRLCELVVNDLRDGIGTRDLLLQNTSFSAAVVEKFRRELELSGQNSVDAFLETRPEYLDVGKAAMATILIRYEVSGNLWGFQPNNWMRYLFDKMRVGTLQSFAQNQVSFVTFNFDRSLEHFLITSLQNTFGAKEEDCANVLEEIAIIHLHGRLGHLPWQRGRTSRPYDAAISPQVLDLCVRDIKVVHEELEDGRDRDFQAAKHRLMTSEKNYFLGFGFGRSTWSGWH